MDRRPAVLFITADVPSGEPHAPCCCCPRQHGPHSPTAADNQDPWSSHTQELKLAPRPPGVLSRQKGDARRGIDRL